MTPLAKRLAIALAISTSINLVFTGFWLGRRYRTHPPRHDGMSLAGERAKVWQHPRLKRAFESEQQDVVARRDAARRARDATRAALQSEPFDPGKFEQALFALRQENAKNQELLHRALVRVAKEGGPAERRDLARAFGRERRGK